MRVNILESKYIIKKLFLLGRPGDPARRCTYTRKYSFRRRYQPCPRLRKLVGIQHGRATVSGELRRATVFGREDATYTALIREVRILERARITLRLA